ncbi:MAG: ribonuclease E/G [Rickettsiales bacterium]|jgi:ribonuclease E|nr:ribonuclease E/G [Rickettsiales bacterium]
MKNIYIDAAHQEETRVVVMDGNRVSDFDIETITKPQIKGNVYLAKVTRIEPSLQAAFISYGSDKNGFLPFSEIHPDYYQVDTEKKKRILELAHANIVDDDEDSDDESSDVADYDDESAGEDNKELTKRASEFKIQDVIQTNQIILIQGVKEERGNKGASMTTFLSLAGRFAVLMPNSRKRNGYGISKKISDRTERARLRDILHKLKIPKGMTLVLRTAAFGASAADIEKDYDFLVSEWNDIRKKTLESTAPAIIHAEDSLLVRVIRDFITDPNDVLTIQGEEAFEAAVRYYQQLYGKKPGKKQIVKYDDVAKPLFSRMGIERQLEGLHGPYVTLPSGGSLVINQTEAMVTIDVNSSRAINESDIEKTAIATNMEAAEEIGLQLRLRDLAGIVAIDFIDMEDDRNNRKLEQKVREVMRRDRARTQVAKINAFGVLMLSRQRMRSSFIDSSYVQCPYCKGAGIVPSIQTAALIMFRHMQDKIAAKTAGKFIMTVPSDIAIYLLNQKRAEINELEGEFGTEIAIIGDDSMTSIADYTIQRAGRDEPKTEDILNSHKPSTETKKKSEPRQNAKKTVVEARRKIKPRQQKQKKKKKSIWQKIIG